MLVTREDAIARAAVRLGKLVEYGGKETKDIIERFNAVALREMNISAEALMNALGQLFKCDSMQATEKFLVLDVFYDLLVDLVSRREEIDLGEIPASLMKMKFMKNEKHIERAIIVYLNVIVLLLQVKNTQEHRINIFKVFCTLFMTKSFITSTRCGYLIPHMFKEFLKGHPEFIDNLLDNEDKLVLCPPLLEAVLSSHSQMNSRLSRVIVVDFIRRKTNSTVLSSVGKGFLDPFYYQVYMERETAPVETLTPILSQKKFLEYLVLDTSLRLTGKNILDRTIEKILMSGPIHLVRMIRSSDEPEGCAYCPVANDLMKHTQTKTELEGLLAEFNKSGALEPIVTYLKSIGFTEPELAAARYLRAHPDTNLYMLGKYIGKENHQNFLAAFCQSFSFIEHSILSALRVFLLCFNLPGEGQQIERIIYAFCTRYAEEKKQHFDTILSVAMSIIILNTSIHNVNMVKKITLEEFTSIVRGDCPNVETDYLESIYEQIKNQKLQVPQSNAASVENIDSIAAQSEADEMLHKERLPRQPGKYCSRCSQIVHLYILERYQIKNYLIENSSNAEIREFIALCMRINARAIAFSVIQDSPDLNFVLRLVYDYRHEILHLWKCFVSTLSALCAAKEESPNGSRFFRTIFAFGKETKKDKKTIFSDSELDEILSVTSTFSDSSLTEVAMDLLAELEKSKSKALAQVAYLLVYKNLQRIHLLTPLLEISISSALFLPKEFVAICSAAPLLEMVELLSDISYKTSKHTSSVVLAVLQHITNRFIEHPPTAIEMAKTEKWLITLISSEAFKHREQEILQNIWDAIEQLALQIDSSGHDSFEVFIKLKDILKEKNKLVIITNTQMYYKSINRVLLCLDLVQNAKNKETEALLLQVFSDLLEKDLEGIASILESCENVLEKTPIHEPLGRLLYEKIKTDDGQSTKYLQKLFSKLNIKATDTEEVIDL
ncbi:hypothetical protein NEHOM01_0996 [Nematocida homosporus]|uniref:uncharacterized protein n=1 Tax=Nematocida homosporus TaxID=1912981 RepID=UPI00221EF287|nr:uncharacterized protein NEHOM01_0996 [Nematocida homosporus]KAI5185704.1 hypothetical protein NEHOM01_0996 [Nematocida homosporus]